MDNYKKVIAVLKDAGRLNPNRVIAVVHDERCSKREQSSVDCDCQPFIHELPEDLPPSMRESVVIDEHGWALIHGHRQAEHPAYPPPQTNLNCRCYPNMHAAFFCMTGHMTECHYPMSCSEAECSHLERYE